MCYHISKETLTIMPKDPKVIAEIERIAKTLLFDEIAILVLSPYDHPQIWVGRHERPAKTLVQAGLLQEHPLCPGEFRATELGGRLVHYFADRHHR